MSRIEWTEAASQDLENVADELDSYQSGLADVAIARIYHAALPLIDHPRLGPEVGTRGYRKWNARKTPFLLLYRVEGDRILIGRVVHGLSDWQSIV